MPVVGIGYHSMVTLESTLPSVIPPGGYVVWSLVSSALRCATLSSDGKVVSIQPGHYEVAANAALFDFAIVVDNVQISTTIKAGESFICRCNVHKTIAICSKSLRQEVIAGGAGAACLYIKPV